MESVYVLINSLDKIKAFLAVSEKMKGNVQLSSEQYSVSAKSAIGIWTLDLSRPLKLQCDEWEEENYDLLKNFMVRVSPSEN
jgi:hypothetical protein